MDAHVFRLLEEQEKLNRIPIPVSVIIFMLKKMAQGGQNHQLCKIDNEDGLATSVKSCANFLQYPKITILKIQEEI